MKKELSQTTTIALIAGVVVVLGVFGYMWMGNAVSGPKEDPSLAQKQLEVERNMRPGGGSQPASNGAQPPAGLAPGAGSEWEARQKANR